MSMVYVRLEKNWTDGEGTVHSAGEMVDVDAATLAALQADGTVSEDWVGPTEEQGDWVGPTGGNV